MKTNPYIEKLKYWFFERTGKLNSYRFKDIQTVCMIIGPYRNMSTLLGSLLYFHPNCQALDHCEKRICKRVDLNFLSNYSDERFHRFLRYAVMASIRGRSGYYGGSMLLSHAFDEPQMIKTFVNRYGRKIGIKKKIQSFIWKGDMFLSNLIADSTDGFESVSRSNEKIRFLMPIRNPLDCAMSNFQTKKYKWFKNRTSDTFESTLLEVLNQMCRFILLAEKNPKQYCCFYENDFTNLISFADLGKFLGLEHDERWLEDIRQAYQHRSAPYRYESSHFDLASQYIASNLDIHSPHRRRLLELVEQIRTR